MLSIQTDVPEPGPDGRKGADVKGRPGWMGTPEQFAAEIKNLGLDLEVLSPEIGKSYTLSK